MLARVLSLGGLFDGLIPARGAVWVPPGVCGVERFLESTAVLKKVLAVAALIGDGGWPHCAAPSGAT